MSNVRSESVSFFFPFFVAQKPLGGGGGDGDWEGAEGFFLPSRPLVAAATTATGGGGRGEINR